MYNALLFLHSALRWIILILLVIAILRHLSGMMSKRLVNAADKKINLFLMISGHITLLIGLYQWFFGPRGLKVFTELGAKVVMENKILRFWAVEHLFGALVAIALITIGSGIVKRAAGPDAHRKAFLLFLLALVLLLAVIPWPGRIDGIARPLLPGS